MTEQTANATPGGPTIIPQSFFPSLGPRYLRSNLDRLAAQNLYCWSPSLVAILSRVMSISFTLATPAQFIRISKSASRDLMTCRTPASPAIAIPHTVVLLSLLHRSPHQTHHTVVLPKRHAHRVPKPSVWVCMIRHALKPHFTLRTDLEDVRSRPDARVEHDCTFSGKG